MALFGRKRDVSGSEIPPEPPSPFDSEGRLRLECWYCGEGIEYQGSIRALSYSFPIGAMRSANANSRSSRTPNADLDTRPDRPIASPERNFGVLVTSGERG